MADAEVLEAFVLSNVEVQVLSRRLYARMLELVDKQVSDACAPCGRGSSNLPSSTDGSIAQLVRVPVS